MIKTGSWYSRLPDDHIKVGISRGTPRGMRKGFRIYRTLAPGTWFNRCASPQEYEQLYRSEVLAPLDPRQVAAKLEEIARGMIPVLVCFEQVHNAKGQWCHRALAAEWLAEGIGQAVPEFGFEHLSQHDHPLMAKELRRLI
jgi:hypothetical protein